MPLGFANAVKKWTPEPSEGSVFVGAARFGAGCDGEEAGAVVVGEFEDEVEIRAAEERGKLKICNPIAMASLGGIRVSRCENLINFGASCEDGIAGFAHENPNLGVREFLLRCDKGGCQ